jgi:hypothetical protein
MVGVVAVAVAVAVEDGGCGAVPVFGMCGFDGLDGRDVGVVVAVGGLGAAVLDFVAVVVEAVVAVETGQPLDRDECPQTRSNTLPTGLPVFLLEPPGL